MVSRKKYAVKTLVWYQQHETMDSAISQEKAMKKWPRKWTLSTIEQTNPAWFDLWSEIVGEATLPVVLHHPGESPTQTECQQDSPPPVVSAKARTQQDGTPLVVPAKAGTQQSSTPPVVPAEAQTRHVAPELDSRMRGKDGSADVSASTRKPR
jgi:hypothetical protein